jgi:flagellar hook assembly protein FlgD
MHKLPMLFVLAAGTLLLMGGTCLPLVDNTTNPTDAQPTRQLAIVLTTPAEDTVVAQGTEVQIAWTASNITGSSATVTVEVESRTDLSKIILLDAAPLNDTGGSGTISWDTDGLSGPYAILAQISAGGLTDTDTAAGQVTVDPPPTFIFTAPTTDREVDPDASPPQIVQIEWTATDNAASLTIGLDVDRDHGRTSDDTDTDEERNEIIIYEEDLTDANDATGSFDFQGQDTSSANVPVGTYYLFAILSDSANADLIVEADAQIIIPEPPEEEEEEDLDPIIDDPNEDVTFLTTDPTLSITYMTNRSVEVIADLKVDADDSHTNGNELTILSQVFVDADENPPAFDWNGDDTGGTPVPVGIYRLLLVISTGSGTPQTTEGQAFVYRRAAASQPLVSLLSPASVQTTNPGSYVTFSWRDSDPDAEPQEGGGDPPEVSATIDLYLDDDQTPDEGDETKITTTSIDAVDDGVRDTFSYQIPAGLAGQTFFVYAKIDRGGSGNVSYAPAQLVVNDPANP